MIKNEFSTFTLKLRCKRSSTHEVTSLISEIIICERVESIRPLHFHCAPAGEVSAELEPVSPVSLKLANSGITNAEAEQRPVMQGENTDGNSVIITGTTTVPNEVIQLYANGQKLAIVTADAEGNWTYRANFEEGTYGISVSSNEEYSKPFIINVMPAIYPVLAEEPLPSLVDLMPVLPGSVGLIMPQLVPEIRVPITINVYDKVGHGGFITSGDAIDDHRPLLSGIANPGEVVRIYANDKLIGEADVDASSLWRLSPVIDNGFSILRAAYQDLAHDSSTFIVYVQAPATPALSITTLYSGEENIPYGGSATGETFILGGTARPGENIELYLNGSLFSSVKASGDGGWSHESVYPEGENTLRMGKGDEYSDMFRFTNIPVGTMHFVKETDLEDSEVFMLSLVAEEVLQGCSDVLFGVEPLNDATVSVLTIEPESMQADGLKNPEYTYSSNYLLPVVDFYETHYVL